MSPNQPINTLDEGCLVEQLERRFPGEVGVITTPKRITNRERNRAAIRATSPVTLSDGECDQVARFLNAGKREAAAQIVKRKASLIRRQNEKGHNPKQKRKS